MFLQVQLRAYSIPNRPDIYLQDNGVDTLLKSPRQVLTFVAAFLHPRLCPPDAIRDVK